ncbi:V-type ATP synthase subunit D [Ruminococcus sp.]|uniref:V-type ATP synthase subunit D n=1 Tax=Ruminococcus sp. TaxID=41978 RepID=UPI0026208022|nr:V-type ATP synthase subunit D [Ruminococcus sp.]MDD6988694.1 V-type ATP synthase subunit D [Ruminococcus sp.]MDY6201604.1 V-type ATP synthase subunit D [Ruminococcus sp.]
MAIMNVNPTRMQLTKLKKQLTTAVRGHKMLKDKRDELMRQFLDLVRENRELREKIEKELSECNAHFVNASAVMSKQALDASLMSPKQQVTIEVDSHNIMSVETPVFTAGTRTHDKGDIFPYGFAFTSFELDDAVMSLEKLLPDLIRLAQIEKSCEMMSAEIEKTRRRVNSLEHVMIPRYQETIKYISMKLEENDRSSRTRLMKVKDMLLDKAHNYSAH